MINTLLALTAASLMLATTAAAAETTAAAVATTAAVAVPDPMQQMVCRKDVETGSLVKTKKTCHTRAQWAYIADTNQRLGRNLVDDTRGRVTGGQ